MSEEISALSALIVQEEFLDYMRLNILNTLYIPKRVRILARFFIIIPVPHQRRKLPTAILI
ncbi:MAG: hypothetical protein ACLUKN_00675 [Bacilli bacterium]